MSNKIREITEKILTWMCDWRRCAAIAQSRITQSAFLMPVFGYLILWSDYIQEKLKLIDKISDHSFLKYIMSISGASINIHTTKFYFLYWGSMLIAFGILLFWVRCPKAIKISKDPMEYINKILSSGYAEEVESAMRNVVDREYNSITKDKLIVARKTIKEFISNQIRAYDLKNQINLSDTQTNEIVMDIRNRINSYQCNQRKSIKDILGEHYNNIQLKRMVLILTSNISNGGDWRANIINILDANHELAAQLKPLLSFICFIFLILGTVLILMPSLDVLFSVCKITFGKLF